MAGCLPDSRGMLAAMYFNKNFKEQRKAVGMQAKTIKL